MQTVTGGLASAPESRPTVPPWQMRKGLYPGLKFMGDLLREVGVLGRDRRAELKFGEGGVSSRKEEKAGKHLRCPGDTGGTTRAGSRAGSAEGDRARPALERRVGESSSGARRGCPQQ